ncbi:hypothetical protein [Bradyrhizobium sp.]|uniref:hypothetical protein n=1 Tax=Bradyrhizobium sp. TaxID=376 RepID=UPI003C25E6D0
MKSLLAGVAMAALVSPLAFAQSASPNQATQPGAGMSASPAQNPLAAQKIKQDLQDAGFTDVKVVAESFVVQAKSKNGDPVLMTIGPHGMSVFEAMNSNGAASSSGTTTGSSSGAPAGSSSPAQK